MHLLMDTDYEIISIKEVEAIFGWNRPGRSIPDEVILALGVEIGALIVTHDSDFGQLVHQHEHPHGGVLLVRPQSDGVRLFETVRQVVLPRLAELRHRYSVLDLRGDWPKLRHAGG